MTHNVFERLLALLTQLEAANIQYTLDHHRADALMVSVAVPGERWEIEYLADGSVEVERFISDGAICDSELLAELFARYAANDAEDAETASAAQAMADNIYAS